MTEPAASAPPTLADPQDPLPESNWTWRRAFVFVLCAVLLAGVWFKVNDLAAVALALNETAIKGLITLLRITLGLVGVLMLFYLISPSAEQVVKMLATLSAWKSGVSTTSTSRAVSSDGSHAEATTSGGPATASPAAPLPPLAPGASASGDMPWRQAMKP